MHFNELIAKAKNQYSNQLPFVLFRKPTATVIKAFFQPLSIVNSVDFTKEGFVFAPFLKEDKAVFFSKKECDTYEAICPSKHDEAIFNSPPNLEFNVQQQHIQLVEKGIQAIKKGLFTKVVLSRQEEVLIQGLDVFRSFEKLLSLYKNAFVYLWYHPKVGCWMGATPERLVKVEKNSFSTMSLAGTKLYHVDKEVYWSFKEQEEQQIVTDYIVQKMKNIVNHVQVSDVATVKAGTLLHLQTIISGDVSGVSLQRIIEQLHPTPAVCGFSTENAREFIQANENYKRAYYSGYLGEINEKSCSELFVNLRCMQCREDKVILYVGGGITADSQPKKEWEETLNKSQIMKKVLF